MLYFYAVAHLRKKLQNMLFWIYLAKYSAAGIQPTERLVKGPDIHSIPLEQIY